MFSYQKERDEFLAIMSSEGMSLATARKLLRYSQTLHRLATAQCNGDYPYNGDRDGHLHAKAGDPNGDKWQAKYYTTCPRCEASGLAKSQLRNSNERAPKESPYQWVKVCPDCRTQELVEKTLIETSLEYWKSRDSVTADYPFKAVFQGDPRGCVFKLQVPSGRTNDWGKEGICVPVRER